MFWRVASNYTEVDFKMNVAAFREFDLFKLLKSLYQDDLYHFTTIQPKGLKERGLSFDDGAPYYSDLVTSQTKSL